MALAGFVDLSKKYESDFRTETSPVEPSTLVTGAAAQDWSPRRNVEADAVPLEASLAVATVPLVMSPAACVCVPILAAASVPLVMLLAFVVSVVADAASPETAPAAIAIDVEPAAVSRPAESTVNVPTLDAPP